MSIATGTKLGQYEVQEFIGQGAMGLVYRAYHVQLERPAAVKVLQALSPDPDTTARFRHEAQAIAQMRHSNIVNVYDFGEFEGTPYMIVEYVPGGSLANRLSQGPVTPTAALKHLRGIAAGLDYAHGLGIVHRDVKPANVLLEKDDTPVLADFGLAKLLQGSSLKSMTGVTTGTPAYMAPEQVMGHQVGPAADRYSLATIAYEMLAGVIPFDGEGLMELLYAQVHREPSPPSVHNTSLGLEVDAVIMRGLAKDPATRWESGTAFVDALAAALASPAVPVDKTMVLGAAAQPSTERLAPPAVAAAVAAVARRPASEGAPATMVVAMPAATDHVVPAAFNGRSASAHPAKPRRRSLMIATAAGLVLVLLLVLGVCAAVAAQGPTLALSPSTVVAGGRVLVTADHVPANKSGEIQLHSQVFLFAFKATASGRVMREIVIPADITPGDHTVQICWDSTCPAHQTLHVVAQGTLLSPPADNTSATPSGASPIPGQTPSSTSGSTPRPGVSPTAAPTNAPAPTPTSAPKPSPSPVSLPRSISLSSTHFNLLGGSTIVSGSHFNPGAKAVITFTQGLTTKQVTSTVNSSGSFVQTMSFSAVLIVGTASITACDPIACAPTQTVQVTAT
ncbi:MAG: serine/threonine-protein kinase [Candidatus Dormibacteraceae bacterium]